MRSPPTLPPPPQKKIWNVHQLATAFSGLFCYGVRLRGPQARKVCYTQLIYLQFSTQVDFGNLSQIPNFHVNSIAFSRIMTSSIFEFFQKRPFTPGPVK